MQATHRVRIDSLGTLVDGRFRPIAAPSRYIESRSPVDPSDLVGVFPIDGAAVDAAVAAARRAAASWGALPLAARLSALRALAAPLAARAAELAVRMQRETGRPPWECEREVRGLRGRLDHTLAHAADRLDEKRYAAGACVRSRPLGCVAVIGPAMLPLASSHTQLIAALAAGNTVVWKPSSTCPASAQLYAELLQAAQLPAGVFNLVQGDREIGAALVDEPRIDAVVFFGRRAQARAVAARCAAAGKHCIVHTGARNAAIVLADADLALAAYEVATSAFLSAGQRATAIARVYVQAEVMDPFAEMLARLVAHLRVGPPTPRTFMGPLLSAARLERFVAERQRAVADRAEALIPGRRLDRPGWFVTPSLHLVRESGGASDPADEELFGPDLALSPTAELAAAMAQLPTGGGALCAALFCRSTRAWQRFAAEAAAGTLLWNRGTTALSGTLPFGAGPGPRGGADAILALRREVTVDARSLHEPELLPGTIDALPDEGTP